MKFLASISLLATAVGAAKLRQTQPETQLPDPSLLAASGPNGSEGLEDSLMALLESGNTPALAQFVSKIKDMLTQMKPRVLDHKKEEQQRLNQAVKRFSACPSFLENAEKLVKDYNTLSKSLQRARVAAAPAVAAAADCLREKKAADELEKITCGALDTLVKSPPADPFSCQLPKSAGTFVENVRKASQHYSDLAKRFAELDKACNSAAQRAATLKATCSKKSAEAQRLSDLVRTLEMQAEAAACSAYKSEVSGCRENNKCYKAASESLASVVKAVKAQEAGMKTEWEGIMRMSCLTRVFARDDVVKRSAIQDCKRAEVDVSHLNLVYPTAPKQAACPAVRTSCKDSRKPEGDCLWQPVFHEESLRLSPRTNSFTIPQAVVPLHATAVLVNVVTRSGGEGPNAWYRLDMWTKDSTNSSNRQRIRGWHYPSQNGISFNSDNFQFEVDPNTRQLRYEIEDPADGNNWHGYAVQILGYRTEKLAPVRSSPKLWTPLSHSWSLPRTNDVSSLDLSRLVPKDAKSVLVTVTQRSGNESPNSWYLLDMWTVKNSTGSNARRMRGWHYPGQNQISFNSNTMEFSLTAESRLFFQWQDPWNGPTNNWHGAEVQLRGYRSSGVADQCRPRTWTKTLHEKFLGRAPGTGFIEIPASAVPSSASRILVNVVIRSGSEGPNSWYHLDLWTTESAAGSNRQRIRGWHYPSQNAISFTSDNFEFGVAGSRKLFWEWNDKSDGTNFHGANVQILGYI